MELATQHGRTLPSDTNHSSFSTLEEEALHPKATSPDQTRDLSGKRKWRTTILVQIFGLLWIAPIVTLLTLNWSSYIIGPTAWCPIRKCYAETFNADTSAIQEKLRRYNRNDHNLLGALQLVSKALDVWFEVIAGFLVYLCTMHLASKKDGLTIAYIMQPFEFSRLPALFDILLWKIAPGIFRPRSRNGKHYRRRIYLFILLIVFLCGLCNLMGPSTAVLVLPTLQWIDTKQVGTQTFVGMNSAAPPRSDGWFISTTENCSSVAISSGNYSCAHPTFGLSLDAWLESSLSSYANGATRQDFVSFALNNTFQTSSDRSLSAAENNTVYWSSSRQAMRNISIDYVSVGAISQGANAETFGGAGLPTDLYHQHTEYNRSLQLILQRNGPILGMIANSFIDANDRWSWTVDVASQQQIRCYSHYDLASLDGSASGNYTKCVRKGPGWSVLNKVANFSISGACNYDTERVGPSTGVTVFSSDKAVFFSNGTIPDWLPTECLRNGTIPPSTTCDWERLFTVDETSPVANRSAHVNTIEYQMRNGNSTAMLATDYVALLGFTTYQLTASPLANPLTVVSTKDIENMDSSISIDPAWTLAAWSADAGEGLLPNRTI